MVDVAIVGAGLAGLCCALRLREIGRSFAILEASDAVGGRIRTDSIGGFQLDRGFQVLLTAYPEAQRMLDGRALDLRAFFPGAVIRAGGRFRRFALPSRLRSYFNSIGSIGDKFRLLSLAQKTKGGSLDDQFAKPEGLTLDLLRWHGFSEAIIDQFFRPFFGVFFLERDLVTSSRLFRCVFRMLGEGDMAVPSAGIDAIPEQLKSRLPVETIRLGAKVENLEPGLVRLRDGEELRARAVVVATEGPEAARLLNGRIRSPAMRGTTSLYFAAAKSPVEEPALVLNADEPGPVSHLAVMTDVSPALAPPGASLVNVALLGIPAQDDSALEKSVREQLAGWFGSAVRDWRHLRTYRIPHALPDQTAPALDPPERPVGLGDDLFVCGAHRDTATIHGAMHSGWRTAQAVAQALSR
jgi:phytoene dehydrogenase-like protein